MTASDTGALLPVTQADREAAAWYVDAAYNHELVDWARHIRAGRQDNCVLVQAFARHRLAAQSEPRAQGVGDIPPDLTSWQPSDDAAAERREKGMPPLSAALARPLPEPQAEEATFALGDRVEKISGSSWRGRIVGTYSTSLTPEGYAVESEREMGSVQIYPAKALRRVSAQPTGGKA